jgi:hypothetical protein
MTTNAEQEIAAKRDAVEKLEKVQAAAAKALRTCEGAMTSAAAALATEKTPKTRRSFLDARDELDVAKVEADAAAKALDAARAELAAMELDHARSEFASALAGVGVDAFKRSIEPEVAALLKLRRDEDAIAAAIVSKIKAHDAALQKVRSLAARANCNQPGRSCADLNMVREMVIIRRRAEVPVLAGMPDVHEWLAPSASVYAT